MDKPFVGTSSACHAEGYEDPRAEEGEPLPAEHGSPVANAPALATGAPRRRSPVEIANVQPPPNPAEPGNRRSLKHGATAELELAPAREAFAAGLRSDFPHLDHRRLAILADRLARIEAARRWLDQQGAIVRDRHGNPWPIVDRLEQWGRTAERLITELEQEARTIGRGAAPTVRQLHADAEVAS